jgi:hypothetical protein
MKTTTSLVLLLPLGAGLLVAGSLVLDPPDAERRPAPSLSNSVNGRAVNLDELADLEPSIDVPGALETIDIEPAKALYLETVILEGGVGDKKAAIGELGQLTDDEAIVILAVALADADARIRRAAAAKLQQIGSDDALAALASGMQEADPARRAGATESLAKAGGYSAVDYLELALRDDDARVRATAVEALGDIGDSRAVNIIGAALRDSDPEVRERAAEMLDQLSDEALFHAIYPPR